MTRSRASVVLFVVLALLAAGWAERGNEPDPVAAPATSESGELRGLMPVLAPPEALSSTWYCAAGSAGDVSVGDLPQGLPQPEAPPAEGEEAPAEGEEAPAEEDDAATATEDLEPEDVGPVLAEHSVVLANVGDVDRAATITVHPGTADPVVADVALPAHSVERVDLADLADGRAVAALVEADGGGVVVSHRLEGETGVDSGPCAATSSDAWYFAWGDTQRDARSLVTLFNPFPGEAVIDFEFATSDGVRQSQALTGIVVPGGSVIVADVRGGVQRRDHVSMSVTARSGRIVAERLQTFDGTAGRTGLAVDLGSPVGHEAAVYQFGRVNGGVAQRLAIFNPGEGPAEVDVEVSPLDDAVGGIEPFELSVRPGMFEVVDLAAEPRLLDAFGEEVGEFVVTVRSLNGVPIASELVTFLEGVTVEQGASLMATEVVLVDTGSDSADVRWLQMLNPSGGVAVTAQIGWVADGEVTQLDEVEIAPAQQVTVEVSSAIARPGALVVRSSGPVVAGLVERWGDPFDLSVGPGVPALATASAIPTLG